MKMIGLLLLACAAGSAAVAEAAEPEAPTYVLFMGTDVWVQRNDKSYRVEDVSGSNLMIRIGREEVFVPTRRGAIGLQVKPGLKLADSSVQLDELASGPGYTWENDPARKLKEAADNSLNLQYAADIADSTLTRSLHNVEAAQDVLAHSNNATDRDWNQAALDRAEIAALNAQQQVNSLTGASLGDMGNLGAGAHQAQVAEGDYDAMEFSFKVSSPVELEHPYLVVLFHFHDPAAKAGVDGLLIHLQALDPIDAKPRYVRVLKGGLPRGFKYLDASVHLYNRGRELPSNVSPNRVEMTRRETQQYLVMEHIGAHKGADSAASAVRGTLTRFRRATLSQEQITRVFYVKVAPDGTPEGIFTNEACDLQIDDAGTLAAVEDIFFRPSLAKGKPVEGVARVCLADL